MQRPCHVCFTWTMRGPITLAPILAHTEHYTRISEYSQWAQFFSALRASSVSVSPVTLAITVLCSYGRLVLYVFDPTWPTQSTPKWIFSFSWKLSPPCLWLAKDAPLFAAPVFGSCLDQCSLITIPLSTRCCVRVSCAALLLSNGSAVM